MIFQIEIDDKYKGIIDDLTDTAGAQTPSEMLAKEAILLIKENLNDYGYNQDGTRKSEDESHIANDHTEFR